MARIYLSSTFRDLAAHRDAAYKTLRRMRHEVIAMEDYVARDDRPAERCVADVLSSDLYVGLFAWRYGHVPQQGNPDRRSVTEMEYRAAAAKRIPCLVFLLDEVAAWPPSLLDSHTGEGEAGARIHALRKELAGDKMVGSFTSPENLAALLGPAVHVAGTLADASDATLDLAGIVGADAVDLAAMLFSESYLPYLVERLSQTGDRRLLMIDLRGGDYWWSTRLFALAALAPEHTPVEWLLFVENGGDHVGMARPRDVRRALAAFQPEMERHYRDAIATPPGTGLPPQHQAGALMTLLSGGFASRPGGEEALRFLVDSSWIRQHVAGLDTQHVDSTGPIDPLGVYLLLDKTTPFVALTKGRRLLKVIDRVGVATEIALTLLRQRVGRGDA
jgi:hypothetical protein